MNIQIDTVNKTLKLQESVNLGEFSEILLKLFPNNEWKEYKLETNTVINNWSAPIIIERYKYKPFYPWNQPYYVGDFPGTYGTSTRSLSNTTSLKSKNNVEVEDNSGVYNVSISN